LFSQHSGHSACGRPCRPCSCSHAKYAAPATSSKLRPPPKGRPGALGMRPCIAGHLSIDKGAIGGDRREPPPSSVTPPGRIDCKAWRRCPRPPMWSASLTAPGFGDLAPRRGSALVTLCCRSWSLIARRAAVIWSPNLGVFAVSAAGVLCAFSWAVDALPGQCLRRRARASPPFVAAFRTRRLLRERRSATCQRRRCPGQARRRQ
jgi:hypothetical protein